MTLRQAILDGDVNMWEITKDHIEQKDCHIKSMYFSHLNKDLMTHKFKLYDDDGELYYEGMATNQSFESAFEPLDWGMADSGCTDIKYLNEDGQWESL